MECIIELTGQNAPTEAHYLEKYLEAQALPMVILGPPIIANDIPTLGIGDFLPMIHLLVESRTAHMAIKGLFDLLNKFFDLRREQCRSQVEIERAYAENKKVKFTLIDPDGRQYKLECQALDDHEQEKFNAIIEKIALK